MSGSCPFRAITRDHDKPEDALTGRQEGMPTIARMARQYLGRHASSAGVERIFSKAGKLHDDLRHRRLMTRWSACSWPPLTACVNWLVCFGCLAEQTANWRPHRAMLRCARCALCCVTVITNVRCVLNACVVGSSSHIVSHLCAFA